MKPEILKSVPVNTPSKYFSNVPPARGTPRGAAAPGGSACARVDCRGRVARGRGALYGEACRCACEARERFTQRFRVSEIRQRARRSTQFSQSESQTFTDHARRTAHVPRHADVHTRTMTRTSQLTQTTHVPA